MTAGRPLQVYLDSSDFSNLANPKTRPQYEDVERRLIGWRDAGLIELRFSYLHVIEGSPVRKEDVPLAVLRLQKVADLCGRKCLVSTISIIEREVRYIFLNCGDGSFFKAVCN